jgi:hypothetical protein
MPTAVGTDSARPPGSSQIQFTPISVVHGRRCSVIAQFDPESLTDPDMSLSIHPARAIARRLPPSTGYRGSSRCRLTPSGGDDVALRSAGISSLLHYRSSPPLPAASVLSASRVLATCAGEVWDYYRRAWLDRLWKTHLTVFLAGSATAGFMQAKATQQAVYRQIESSA